MAKPTNIRDSLTKRFRDSPDKELDITVLRKSHGEVSDPTLFYHLRKLKDEGFLLQPRHGWYRYNPEYKTFEERQKMALEAGRARVVQSQAGWSPTQPAITVTDERWKRYLESAVKNILERMATDAPANKLFHQQDKELIEELLQGFIRGGQPAS